MQDDGEPDEYAREYLGQEWLHERLRKDEEIINSAAFSSPVRLHMVAARIATRILLSSGPAFFALLPPPPIAASGIAEFEARVGNQMPRHSSEPDMRVQETESVGETQTDLGSSNSLWELIGGPSPEMWCGRTHEFVVCSGDRQRLSNFEDVELKRMPIGRPRVRGVCECPTMVDHSPTPWLFVSCQGENVGEPGIVEMVSITLDPLRSDDESLKMAWTLPKQFAWRWSFEGETRVANTNSAYYLAYGPFSLDLLLDYAIVERVFERDNPNFDARLLLRGLSVAPYPLENGATHVGEQVDGFSFSTACEVGFATLPAQP